MFDRLSSRGHSRGAHPYDCGAARLDAQQQAISEIAGWLDKIPDAAPGSFCTVTVNLSFAPCLVGKSAFGAIPKVRASCIWTVSAARASGLVRPPAGKTSAFNPSSRFSLLGDQYYEAAGTARGEDTISQIQACADAQKKAHHQAMESAGKAGLCDREDAAMRIAISFAPPRPALLGGGRYGLSAYEAICDWNLVIEAVRPDPGDLQSSDFAGTVTSGSLS